MTKRNLKKLHRNVGTITALKSCRKTRDKKTICYIALADIRANHGALR